MAGYYDEPAMGARCGGSGAIWRGNVTYGMQNSLQKMSCVLQERVRRKLGKSGEWARENEEDQIAGGLDGHLHRERSDHFGEGSQSTGGQGIGAGGAEGTRAGDAFGHGPASAEDSGSRADLMKAKRQKISLPLGRAALVAIQLSALRDECCVAADRIIRQNTSSSEVDLEECARLDDALAEAQRILKATVAQITCSRLRRGSRAR